MHPIGPAAMSLRARLAMSISQFLSARGVYLEPRSTKIHVALYRRSGGKIGGHLPGWPAAPISLLDHIGAKSGIRRTSPVMYHQDGGWLAMAASKVGQRTNPAWFHNVKANPDTTIQIGTEQGNVRSRVATEHERDVLWPKFVAFYPGYEFFQRNARNRTIPIVILEPRSAPVAHE